MCIRLGINGFGRIGKLVLRAIYENPQFMSQVEIVGINDARGVDSALYKVKYDSSHGRFNREVKKQGDSLIIDGKKIKIFSEKEISKIDWGHLDVDCVLECTGKFLTYEMASLHLKQGAKKVLISAPAKDETIGTYVFGVNHLEYMKEQLVLSNASCTTNCIAPIAKILEDQFGIEEGFMATIHAATLSQNTLDSVSGKQMRDGRASFGNIIPTSTGATKAMGKVIPSLKDKFTGISYRVPTLNVSMVDITVRLKKKTSLEEIAHLIQKKAQTEYKGILSYTEDEVVSMDINHDSHSSIYDYHASIALNDQFFKLIAWYDNEWGYSNRMVDMAIHISK